MKEDTHSLFSNIIEDQYFFIIENMVFILLASNNSLYALAHTFLPFMKASISAFRFSNSC